jgi:hypothetical protein
MKVVIAPARLRAVVAVCTLLSLVSLPVLTRSASAAPARVTLPADARESLRRGERIAWAAADVQRTIADALRVEKSARCRSPISESW